MRVERMHKSQELAEFTLHGLSPHFRESFVSWAFGLFVCTTSQVRGLNLSKTRQILHFLRESNFLSPAARAFLWNRGDSTQ